MLAVVQPYSASTPDVGLRRPNISSSAASSRSVSANLAPNPPPSLQRHQTAPPTVPTHTRTPTPPPKQADIQEAPFDINTYPPSDLLKLLALLLTHIATTNDPLSLSNAGSTSHSQQPPLEPVNPPPIWYTLTTASRNAISTPAATLTFHARNIPTITLEAYLMRILKYCPTSNHVFLSLLVYFDRMSKLSEDAVGRAFVIDSYNIHRLVIAGVTVASKFFSDVFYTNSRYAKVGGLPLPELNQLELQFLLLNDFRLVISSTEMQHYAEQLILFAKSTSSSNTFASGPASTVHLPSISTSVPSSSAPLTSSSPHHPLQNGHAPHQQQQQIYRQPMVSASAAAETLRPDSAPPPPNAPSNPAYSSSSSSSTIVGSTPHSHPHHPHSHNSHPQPRHITSPHNSSTPSAYPTSSHTSSFASAPSVPPPSSYPAAATSTSTSTATLRSPSASSSSSAYTDISSPARPLDALGGVSAPVHNPTGHPAYLPHTHPPHSNQHPHPPGYLNGIQYAPPQQQQQVMYGHSHRPGQRGGMGYPPHTQPQAYHPTPTSASSSSVLASAPAAQAAHRPAHPPLHDSFSASSGADGDVEDDADTSTDAGTETSTDDEPTVRAPGTVFDGSSVSGSVWGGDDDREETGRERQREDALMRSP